MAFTPAWRAARPSSKRGQGRRCATTRGSSSGAPSRRRRRPAADRPRGPVTKMVSPGRAPLRSTEPLPGVSPITVTATETCGALVRSPPTIGQFVMAAASAIPRCNSSRSVPGGAETATTAARGRPPMAARSETADATALYPRSSRGKRSGERWTPHTATSVEMRASPANGAKTAASSPTWTSPAGTVRRPTIAAIRSKTASSRRTGS